MKFQIVTLLLLLCVWSTNAVGIGSVFSAVGNLKKLYDFIKGWTPVDKPLQEKYVKQWPYHNRLKEVQYKPKGFQDIFIFMLPQTDSFSPSQYEAYAQDVHNVINTAEANGYTFKRTMDVLNAMDSKYNWYFGTHTIYGPGKLKYKRFGDKPEWCVEFPKWTYVTMGPERDYLFDTKIIQGWHNTNYAGKGKYIEC